MSKIVNRLLLVLVIMSLSVGAFAATYTVHGALTIDSYTYLVTNDGKNLVQVKVNEPLSTGCPASDIGRIFSLWPTGVDEHLKMVYSTIQSAAAMQKKISIRIRDDRCHSSWGAEITGITVES